MEAARARIRALESALATQRETWSKYQDALIGQHNAEAQVKIAQMEAERARADARRERDIAVESARLEVERELSNCRAEREALEARLKAEVDLHKAEAALWKAECEAISAERDVLREMSPATAAQYYKEQADSLRRSFANLSALRDGGDAHSLAQTDDATRAAIRRSHQRSLDSLAASIDEMDALVARMMRAKNPG